MNKRQREHLSIIPGCPTAAAVINGDINYALTTWKQSVKEQKLIDKLKDKRTYKKPTTVRREQLNTARYYQQIRSMNEQ